MIDYTAKRIGDMQSTSGGGFVKARAELGVTSFGIQVIRLPPDSRDYPEHDHTADGQEEVYLAIAGSGRIEIEGDTVELTSDTLVRVGPAARRKVYAGPEGITLLVTGNAPGEVFKAKPFSELTTP